MDHSLADIGNHPRLFAIPERRLLFVSVPKNACTALKWMMADIVGEEFRDPRIALGPFVNRSDIVHARVRWQRLPQFGKLPKRVRAEISPDNGWFIFGVVRDPRVRLFSAWQNKLLMRNPRYTEYHEEKWYPGWPGDAQAMIEDFARFTEALSADAQHPLLLKDAHFQAQTDLLMLDRVPYSRIYDVSEVAQLCKDVQAHLEQSGWEGELALRRLNDTPLRATAAAFQGGVRELIEEKIYPGDFAEFGDRWDFGKVENAPEWTESALAEVSMYAESGERIGELRDIALALKTRNEQLEQQLEDLREARVGGPLVAKAEALTRRAATRLKGLRES